MNSLSFRRTLFFCDASRVCDHFVLLMFKIGEDLLPLPFLWGALPLVLLLSICACIVRISLKVLVFMSWVRNVDKRSDCHIFCWSFLRPSWEKITFLEGTSVLSSMSHRASVFSWDSTSLMPVFLRSCQSSACVPISLFSKNMHLLVSLFLLIVYGIFESCDFRWFFRLQVLS